MARPPFLLKEREREGNTLGEFIHNFYDRRYSSDCLLETFFRSLLVL